LSSSVRLHDAPEENNSKRKIRQLNTNFHEIDRHSVNILIDIHSILLQDLPKKNNEISDKMNIHFGFHINSHLVMLT